MVQLVFLMEDQATHVLVHLDILEIIVKYSTHVITLFVKMEVLLKQTVINVHAAVHYIIQAIFVKIITMLVVYHHV